MSAFQITRFRAPGVVGPGSLGWRCGAVGPWYDGVWYGGLSVVVRSSSPGGEVTIVPCIPCHPMIIFIIGTLIFDSVVQQKISS